MRTLSTRADQNVGLVLAIASAAFFATSGTVGKAMQESGWSAGATVFLRVGVASAILLPFAVRSVWGRAELVQRNLSSIVAYGIIAVAGCQVTYFYALQRLSVGVALLLEYVGVLLVVVIVAARRRALPGRVTRVGVVVALVGLLVVLDLSGQSTPDPIGLMWGLLAACGLAIYFLLASRPSDLPPVALAGFGMALGAVVLGVLGALRIVPFVFSANPVTLVDRSWPWWFGILELALVAGAIAYLTGIVGARRLGSTVASFIGLTEVLFAILIAWLVLAELPSVRQLLGGLILLAGVIVVKVGERDRADAAVPATADLAEVPVAVAVRS